MPADRPEAWPDGLHDFATAVMFLTRIPVPWTVPGVEARLARSTPWFPVVGAGVGALGAIALGIGVAAWGPVIGALLAVATTALVTGGFHEDGLADTFDGLGGSLERDRALEIMQDSRLGTFGALALGLGVALRVAALAGLARIDPGWAVAALVGGHALARYASLPLIRWLAYARANGGTGKPFAGGVTERGLLLATGFTALLSLFLWGSHAPAAWLAGAAVLALLAAWFQRRLGGITGDTLGAANQAVELAAYLTLLATVA